MRFVLPLILLVGCYTEASWSRQQTTTACKRIQECDPDGFDSLYESQADCRDDLYDGTEDLTDCLVEAGCEFDAKAAASCHQEMRQASCDEFNSGSYGGACEDVYSCTTGQAVDAGICLFGGGEE